MNEELKQDYKNHLKQLNKKMIHAAILGHVKEADKIETEILEFIDTVMKFDEKAYAMMFLRKIEKKEKK